MRKELTLLFSFLLWPGLVFAAPTVSSVSNSNPSHGQSITISGSGFGAKSTASPGLWDTVENQYSLSDGATIPTGGSYPWGEQCVQGGGSCVKYSTSSQRSSVSTAKYMASNTQYGYLGLHSVPTTDNLYLSFWVWLSDSFASHSGNSKLLRMGHVATNGYSYNVGSDYWFYGGSNYCTLSSCDEVPPNHSVNWCTGSSALTGGTWHKFDYFSHTNSSFSGAYYSITIDGVYASGPVEVSTCGSYFQLDNVDLLGLDYQDSGSTIYLDDIYVDNTAQRVEVCAGSTWSARGHCEMQIPTAWSDSSATVIVNRGSFAENSSVYLYVVGTDNTAGRLTSQITFGTGGGTVDTTPPTCAINVPTSAATWDNGAVSTINLGGVAYDETALSSVTWVCPTCTPTSGTASGTTSWAITGIVLASGSNVITTTAHDSSGNTGTDSITATYTPAGGGLTDSIVDNDTTGKTSSSGTWTSSTYYTDRYGANYRYADVATATYTFTESNLVSGGTYNIYEWHSDGNEWGGRSDTTDHAVIHNGGTSHVNVNQNINGGQWNLVGQYVASGTTLTVTITACDGCWDGTVADAIRFTQATGDSTAPTTVISTADPSAISADSLAVAGTSSDAVGVVGCKSRIAAAPDATHGDILSGTTSWSGTVTGFSEGANTLYVGCYDAAGNYGSDSITVNYTLPATVYPQLVGGMMVGGMIK